MNSGASSVLENYNAQINLEIGNIHAKPLGYDASRLVELLDEFELDPRVSWFLDWKNKRIRSISKIIMKIMLLSIYSLIL